MSEPSAPLLKSQSNIFLPSITSRKSKLLRCCPITDAYYNRGSAYGNQGNYAAAIADFTKAIQINPQDANAYINRGLAYCNSGHKSLARDDVQKAAELGYKGGYVCQ